MTDVFNYEFYIITCKDTNITDCYVGSTKDIVRRKSEHKANYNTITYKAHNFPVYKFIRANGGWDNFNFNVIATGKYTKENKRIREQELITSNKATLNSIKAHRTKEQKRIQSCESASNYRANNPEKCKDSVDKWRKDNVVHMAESSKAYRENNVDKVKAAQKEWSDNNKEYNKERMIKFKEKNPNYFAEYKEANKEAIAESSKKQDKKFSDKVKAMSPEEYTAYREKENARKRENYAKKQTLKN